MIPTPLHPAVVHFPIVLATLAPFAIGLTLWGIWSRGAQPTLWRGMVLLQLLLVLTTWGAIEAGENEEEAAEHFVAERYIEQHEEAAERLMTAAVITLVLVVAGLLRSQAGRLAQGTALAGSVLCLFLAGSAGHSGGELVYRHGAATAYLDEAPASMLGAGEGGRELRHSDHDDDDDDD